VSIATAQRPFRRAVQDGSRGIDNFWMLGSLSTLVMASILPGMPCALSHAAFQLQQLVTALRLSGQFSASSMELLSKDTSGRLFHTLVEQE
jgi:hypothetical protein